jgi:hypothetical protein
LGTSTGKMEPPSIAPRGSRDTSVGVPVPRLDLTDAMAVMASRNTLPTVPVAASGGVSGAGGVGVDKKGALATLWGLVSFKWHKQPDGGKIRVPMNLPVAPAVTGWGVAWPLPCLMRIVYVVLLFSPVLRWCCHFLRGSRWDQAPLSC